jgi:hypothetical protein
MCYSSQEQVAVLIGLSPQDLSKRKGAGADSLLSLIVNWGINQRVNLAWLLSGEGEPHINKDMLVREETPPYASGTADGEGFFGKAEFRKVQGQRMSVTILGPKNSQTQAPPGYPFKVSDALTMAARVLDSRTSYATALYLNIQHFDRALRSEESLASLKEQNERQAAQIAELEAKYAAQQQQIIELKRSLDAWSLEKESKESMVT